MLRAVHLLDKQLVGSWHKLHARKVVVAFISRDGQPCRRTTISTHIANFYGAVGCASFGVGEMLYRGVDAVHIIDDVEPSCSACITLPICDILTVSAPSETVSAIEFFFIYPVERTVHDCVIAVCREGTIGLCLQIFYINVVFTHISNLAGIRRKFGEHQTAFW